MRDALEYLAHVKALIVANARVAHWTMLREEAQGDIGLYRCKLTLQEGSTVEMFEFFRIRSGGELEATTYSFHWQDESGLLRKRWDNAPHHRKISTFPHHLHDGSEECVTPCGPMTAERVLAIFSAEAAPESMAGGTGPA